MEYSSDIYVAEAVKAGLIKSDDQGGSGASADVDLFKYGHLTGIEAIKFFFFVKSTQPIPQVTKNLKKLTAIVLEKLRNSFYDGRLLDDIIKETTKNIGERLTLYQSIMEADSVSPFLSFDKIYSHPRYEAIDIDVTDGQYEIYDDLFDNVMDSQRPRKRDDILLFLEAKKVYIGHLDKVIHYLVKMKLV